MTPRTARLYDALMEALGELLTGTAPLSERRRIAKTILSGGAVLSAFALAFAIALRPAPVGSYTPYAVTLGAHLLALGLVAVGFVRAAVVTFALLYGVMVTHAMWHLGGVHAPAAMTLPPIVLFVGLTWNGRAAFATALAASAALAFFVYAEHTGSLPEASPAPSARIALVGMVTLLITGLMLATALRVIVTSRRQAIESQRAKEQLQLQLARSQRVESVGRLAAGVAHDFNNVLTIVLLEAHRLQAGKAEVAESASMIYTAAERAAALTRQLLAFGRPHVVEREPLDVTHVVATLEPLLRSFVGGRVDFRVELASGLPPLLADRIEIEQLLLNFITNARDAMPRGGTLTVRTTLASPALLARCGFDARHAQGLCLVVQDTGIGMSEETRARLFEPFFTTKDHGRGTGLGLPTVQGIVERMGGVVLVDSEVGRGSTFTVVFPVDTTPAPVARVPEVVREHAAGQRIALVDDEPVLRESLAQVLREAGFDVRTAANATALLDSAPSWDAAPELLLTDVVLPDMSGPELARRLRERVPTLRVLFMSGYAESLLADQGVPLDEVHFIAKPLDPAALCSKVARVLAANDSVRAA